MDYGFKDEAEFFGAILNYPNLINLLSINERYDIDFINDLYMILGDEILPHIPYYMIHKIKQNKHEKISHKNIKNYETILHNILTNIETINELSTNEKYDNDTLEFLYLIWGDELKDYLPKEMYEQLSGQSEDEILMNKYHNDYYETYKEAFDEDASKQYILRKL